MRYLALLMMIGLSACATMPKSGTVTVPTQTDKLSARTLAPGECGLFVWTADSNKHFILFSQSRRKNGVWYNGTVEEQLTISALRGRPENGQYPVQSLKTPGAQTIVLDLKTPEVIDNGTRFKTGTLTLSAEGQWDRVTPVVGLAACQTGT